MSLIPCKTQSREAEQSVQIRRREPSPPTTQGWRKRGGSLNCLRGWMTARECGAVLCRTQQPTLNDNERNVGRWLLALPSRRLTKSSPPWMRWALRVGRNGPKATRQKPNGPRWSGAPRGLRTVRTVPKTCYGRSPRLRRYGTGNGSTEMGATPNHISTTIAHGLRAGTNMNGTLL